MFFMLPFQKVVLIGCVLNPGANIHISINFYFDGDVFTDDILWLYELQPELVLVGLLITLDSVVNVDVFDV